MPNDKKWGLLESDGKWNGMIRELVDGDIDIASGGLAISFERAQVVDYRYFEFKNPVGFHLNFPLHQAPHYLLGQRLC